MQTGRAKPICPALQSKALQTAQVMFEPETGKPSTPPAPEDLEMDQIVRFAHLASIALDNARLHTSLEQRVRERTHELATLNAVAAVVSRWIGEG